MRGKAAREGARGVRDGRDPGPRRWPARRPHGKGRAASGTALEIKEAPGHAQRPPATRGRPLRVPRGPLDLPGRLERRALLPVRPCCVFDLPVCQEAARPHCGRHSLEKPPARAFPRCRAAGSACLVICAEAMPGRRIVCGPPVRQHSASGLCACPGVTPNSWAVQDDLRPFSRIRSACRSRSGHPLRLADWQNCPLVA